MNEPIGRFGSCRPARARRTAVETASTASRWPMTRLASASSIFSSFSRSPSSMRSTGMPVQRDTTPAIWSGVTASSTMAPFGLLRLDRLQLLLELGDARRTRARRRLREVAAALRLLQLGARLVELLLELLGAAELLLLGLPVLRQDLALLLEVGDLLLELLEAVLAKPRRSPCAAPRARS